MKTLEEEIIEKGLTASRVTPEAITSRIAAELYFTGDSIVHDPDHNQDLLLPGLKLLTICVLVLNNGYTTIVGESSCANAENFNFEMGRRRARDKAIEKLRDFEGYLMKDELYPPNAETKNFTYVRGG